MCSHGESGIFKGGKLHTLSLCLGEKSPLGKYTFQTVNRSISLLEADIYNVAMQPKSSKYPGVGE